MKLRLTFIAAFFLAVAPLVIAGQTTRKAVEDEPPSLETVVASAAGEPSTTLGDLVAIEPEIPLGPPDRLSEYEQAMAIIPQNLSAEIAIILQAQQSKQISREQAESLIKERYQIATMQHEVLSALRDVLARDVALAVVPAKRIRRSRESDTAIVVEIPSPGSSRGCQ